MPSKYHNLSNEALADDIGRVDMARPRRWSCGSCVSLLRPIVAPATLIITDAYSFAVAPFCSGAQRGLSRCGGAT
jgi:hypothetical protein